MPATAAATSGRGQRRRHAHHGLAGAQARQVRAAGVAAEHPHAGDHVGAEGVLAGADRRALLLVGGVGEARRLAGARLDHDRGAQLE